MATAANPGQGDDGREAMNEGRASVGVPDHKDGDRLTVDLDGRYWIEEA